MQRSTGQALYFPLSGSESLIRGIHIIRAVEAYTPARFHSNFVSVLEEVIHGPLPSLFRFTFLDELAIPSISSCKIPYPVGEKLVLLISLSSWEEKVQGVWELGVVPNRRFHT